MNKTIKIVLSIFAVVAVAIVVVATQNRNSITFVGTSLSNIDTIKTKNIPSQEIPSDWLIYSDNDLGWQIQYPKDLQSKRKPSNSTIVTFLDYSPKDVYQVLVSVDPLAYKGIREGKETVHYQLLANEKISKNIIPENITLNGLSGMKYDTSDAARYYVELFKEDNTGLVRHYTLWINKFGDERDTISEKMLSTFMVP
jgi:hypothetical protein